MSYKLQLGIDGIFEVILKDEPSYFHGLRMAPKMIEPELNHSVWLVVVFAVWSGPDISALKLAFTLGRKFAGEVQVGLRPFEEYEEILTWCPQVKMQNGGYYTPAWIVLKDGTVIEILYGCSDRNKLQASLIATLQQAIDSDTNLNV